VRLPHTATGLPCCLGQAPRCGTAAHLTRAAAAPAERQTVVARGLHAIALVGVAVPAVLGLSGLALLLLAVGRRV
jgi:hypothetical protein